MLGGIVRPAPGEAALGADRGGVDDRAGSLRDHHARDRGLAEEDAAQVDREDAVEFRERIFVQGEDRAFDACVVEEAVDAAEPGDRGVDIGLDFLRLRAVGAEGLGVGAGGAQLGGALLQPVADDVDEHQPRALFGEDLRGGEADGAGGAGDDDRAILVVGHAAILCGRGA